MIVTVTIDFSFGTMMRTGWSCARESPGREHDLYGKQDFLVNPAYREDVYSRFRFLGKVKGLYKYKFLKNNR